VTTITLWLPSDLPDRVRPGVATEALIKTELALLLAELHDCLVTIRKYRRALAVTRKSSRGYKQAGSVGANRTRQRVRISGIGEKIENAKLRYQHAWRSAHSLDPAGEWALNFRWLDTKDIRGPSAADDLSDLAATKIFKKLRQDAPDLGQGIYERSWIWSATLNGNTDPDGALCVEWAKSRANALRWEEELVLVPEEMRRSLAYFEWQAASWRQRLHARPTASLDLRSALDVHARRQEDLLRQRIAVFASAWVPYLTRLGLGGSWTAQYTDLVPSSAWDAPRRGAVLGCEYLMLSAMLLLF
jgi:hypothetical protein